MPQLPTLTSQLAQWRLDFDSLPRNAAIPRRLVEQAIGLSEDLTDEPNTVVLHGNLHYGTVLAADREPWLAISPESMNGDPHFELAPMLWNRWDELAGNIRDGVGDASTARRRIGPRRGTRPCVGRRSDCP